MRVILGIVVFILFISPKIDIIDIENFNAGLRFDDFILLITLVYLASVSLISPVKNFTISSFEVRYFVFIAIMLVGTVYGNYMYDRGSLLSILYFSI